MLLMGANLDVLSPMVFVDLVILPLSVDVRRYLLATTTNMTPTITQLMVANLGVVLPIVSVAIR